MTEDDLDKRYTAYRSTLPRSKKEKLLSKEEWLKHLLIQMDKEHKTRVAVAVIYEGEIYHYAEACLLPWFGKGEPLFE